MCFALAFHRSQKPIFITCTNACNWRKRHPHLCFTVAKWGNNANALLQCMHLSCYIKYTHVVISAHWEHIDPLHEPQPFDIRTPISKIISVKIIGIYTVTRGEWSMRCQCISQIFDANRGWASGILNFIWNLGDDFYVNEFLYPFTPNVTFI